MPRVSFALKARFYQGLVGILELSGHSESDPQAAVTVGRAVASCLGKGARHLVYDVAHAEWLTVDVIGELVADVIRVSNSGGHVVFCGAQGGVAVLLRDLGVLEYVQSFPTQKDALLAIARSPRQSTVEPRTLPRFALRREEQAGAVVFSPSGALHADAATQMSQAVQQELAAGRGVVIEGSALTHLDSDSMATLIHLGVTSGDKVQLATVWGAPGAMFEAMPIMTIHPTVEDALKALG